MGIAVIKKLLALVLDLSFVDDIEFDDLVPKDISVWIGDEIY